MVVKILALAYSLGLSRGQLLSMAREAAGDARIQTITAMDRHALVTLIFDLRAIAQTSQYAESLLRNTSCADMIAA